MTNGEKTKACARCPSCGGENIEQTLAGILRGPDTNRARCLGCGWKGIAEQTKT